MLLKKNGYEYKPDVIGFKPNKIKVYSGFGYEPKQITWRRKP